MDIDFDYIRETEKECQTGTSFLCVLSLLIHSEHLQNVEQCDRWWEDVLSISEGPQSHEGDGCVYESIAYSVVKACMMNLEGHLLRLGGRLEIVT